ncbi:MAG: hypothetical protein EXR65_04775 [Dehalococcoidia bacterium]|nr:hypothetical protein [Dehalococcoidia bacterium]
MRVGTRWQPLVTCGSGRYHASMDAFMDVRLQRLIDEGPRATVLIELPGGRFRMGSTWRADEQPVRDLMVGPFAVALAPVSNAEYGCFLQATDHEAPPFWSDQRFSHPAQPAVGVSWHDAVAYCRWLSALLGRSCRLPAEAEREFAARGGRPDVLYPWGDEPWLDGPFAPGAAGTDRPLVLGSTSPNGYGLYHMAENVHEWCSDWYDMRGYGEGLDAPVGRPTDAPAGARRASRGGSWRHRVKVSRIAARSSLPPGFHYNDYGMRVYAAAGSTGPARANGAGT